MSAEEKTHVTSPHKKRLLIMFEGSKRTLAWKLDECVNVLYNILWSDRLLRTTTIWLFGRLVTALNI